ncbi:MAG TPA: UTP--glucose-1-phosphate uridylyltransferase [Candidatus Wujingus californicus]|uniref:UTP--glucose-1-phosphate uridylyltransferase n=1 Tax=Candidatus Wujingus californicus TaxID=3367618 RepID=UPI001D608062|nr:UDPGP type 1 family protein [Planctomycetota bacterium]MDO8130306.1 UDPGP type 1 family protein [Candidatus Brocadiales bacterium]
MNIKILEKLDKEFPSHGSCLRNALEAGQGHIFGWWDEITSREKKHLLEQISSIDFQFVNKLFRNSLRKVTNRTKGRFVPPKVITPPANDLERNVEQKVRKVGEKALRERKIAVLTVAGGHGTRLGSNGPKGTLPIAPISGKSIFQLHAEKIHAIQKRYDTYIPWYIMTSETNNRVTQAFFKENQFFRLDSQQISFFTQGMLPAVDLHGNLLMSSKANIVMSPNGHGGTIIALNEKGILNDMKRRGVKEIFYHQVDNVLTKIADPVFVGYHLKDGAEMSLKVVKKCHPEEKVGVVVCLDGCLQIIEYSELSKEDMYAKNDDGALKYNAGSIAVHMINIDFLEKVYQKGETLPYHAAIKKVPYINGNGVLINPERDNAVKFESFIFDMLKHVKKGVIMEVLRQDEFSPVKNVEGENSPVTAKQDMVNLFGRWLCNAGISIPTDSQGNVIGLIEINPFFALDEEELKSKIDKTLKFNGFLSL